MDLGGLYRDIVETSPDGIWVFDLSGRTIYANPEIARMYGCAVDEVAELTVFDTLDDDGKVMFAEHLRALRNGHVSPTDVECLFVRRDRTTMWVLLRESVVRGTDGQVVIIHSISDYSVRRRTVERLAETQRIARIGSWEWDAVRNQLVGSDELSEVYGHSALDFPGDFEGFLQLIHPDDRDEVGGIARRSIRDGSDLEFVARVKGVDGWIWTRARGVPHRDPDGRVIAMSGTHHDVTELKLAELALIDQVNQNNLMQIAASAANEAHTLRDVLVQVRELVLVHDDWRRARGFAATPDGSGVEPMYVSEDERGADGATPDETAMELELATEVHRSGVSIWSADRLTLGFPVSFDQQVLAVVTITSDPPLYRHDMIEEMVGAVAAQLGRVAEREHAQQVLADARDEAMAASRQKSEFLATMSHEIRTPLNGVIGLNDLLLRTGLRPDQLRLASGVQVASRALLTVINDVLDFSKIEAGRLDLERIDFEVRPVFERVAGVLAEDARAQGLELIVACHPDVPEMLAGDPTRLSQVLNNLVSNAVKFTESGEVYARATASDGPGDTTVLRVEVRDTGIGIDAADVDGLFTPFTQADASTTRLYGGTGLGLAISKEIVEALGGEIWYAANPAGGSVFTFTAVFHQPVAAGGAPEDTHARTWLAGKRVLVVDDNTHNRLIMEEQLAWWQMRASSAAGAAEAITMLSLAFLEGDPFVACLLDLAMPEQDGLDLADEIRSDPVYDDVPLLMLTSISTVDPTLTSAHGISECLVKPVPSDILRGVLLEHLADVVAPESIAPHEAGTGPRRHRILVVEDNPVNQMVATGLLEAMGYVVATAEDGATALQVLASTACDAVLMDVQMPVMDGYAATRAIRADERGSTHLPVIAMTAAAVEGERERCLAAGMDDYLTKPVDPTALSATLTHWLGPLAGRPPVHSGAALPPSPPVEGLDTERLDMLRDLDPGDTSYLDRAIGNFRVNSVAALAGLREHILLGDAAAMRAAAHKIAGSSLNLGLVDAGAAAGRLEDIGSTGTVEGASDLLPELEVTFERGRALLLAYQATYATRTDVTTEGSRP